MRACSPDAGRTRLVRNGGLHFKATSRPWPNTWGTTVTRLPDSSATWGIVLNKPGWPEGLRITKITRWKTWLRSGPPGSWNTWPARFRESFETLDISSLSPLKGFVIRWFEAKRKNAALIRRAFLGWVSQREETSRPFFAFLNFFDAHQQYILPLATRRRFVNYSLTAEENRIVYELWPYLDKTRLPRAYVDVARDSYDDCLSYIDEQLGLLFDAMQRYGVLNRTLVIVTSDHGEGLGDHDLFDHGLSLYRTEIRVPLVIRPPSALNPSSVVEETVSLRDLPATIVDLVGLGAGSPFPGVSLARFWRNSPSKGVDRLRETEPVVSELKEPNSSTGGDKERSPGLHGPLISLAADNFVYIRNEGDGNEQLFDMHRSAGVKRQVQRRLDTAGP